MYHVMVDLETLGTTPGCSIISIGAVGFYPDTPEESWSRFYSGPISRESCQRIGMHEEIGTLDWWMMQEPAARSVFDSSSYDSSSDIRSALTEFAVWYPEAGLLWGNGADFDNAVLATAYYRANISKPWNYKNSRCFRTIKAEHPLVKTPAFIGVKHNALDDAMNQARLLVKILRSS